MARWTITEVRGKGKACLSCFSTYRSFRGATALAGEGLVVRECRAHGWEVTPANLARTEKAYFDDLGAAITQKLAAGHAVIVGGDINIDHKREKEFREWLTGVGLLDTGAEGDSDTFFFLIKGMSPGVTWGGGGTLRVVICECEGGE